MKRFIAFGRVNSYPNRHCFPCRSYKHAKLEARWLAGAGRGLGLVCLAVIELAAQCSEAGWTNS